LLTFIVKENLQNAITHLGEVKYQNQQIKANFFDVMKLININILVIRELVIPTSRPEAYTLDFANW
jgi:hypothetical protein